MTRNPRIVAATGVASGKRGPTAAKIEAAMADAIRQARAEGITDPAEIKKRMLDARARMKAG